jgi:hypothetical protein
MIDATEAATCFSVFVLNAQNEAEAKKNRLIAQRSFVTEIPYDCLKAHHRKSQLLADMR